MQPNRFGPATRLFLVSFTILFFELVCIRWTTSYIRLFAYFQNFALLAALLGIGLGVLASRRPEMKSPPFRVVVGVMVAVVLTNRLDVPLTSTSALYFGSESSTHESYLFLPLIFVFIALAFFALARPLGPLLREFPPLKAYTIDILGSMAGVAAFFFMSLLSTPPWVWFAVAFAAHLAIVPPDRRRVTATWAVFIIAATVWQGHTNLWSPYYKIALKPGNPSGTEIYVNNTGHQWAVTSKLHEPFYHVPYDVLGTVPFRRVLILGAGSGSDVAIALAHGAERVDAVEIDPTIQAIGKRLHPDHPYDDPRVTPHIDDARAYLTKATGKYDLVVFALTDSLTLVSNQSSLRLESFLYTEEAVERVKSLLADDGLLVMYNYYRQDWLIRKLAGTIRQATGWTPYVATYGDWGRAAVLMAGPRLASLPQSLAVDYTQPPVPAAQAWPSSSLWNLPMIGAGLYRDTEGVVPPTDDWPFVYLLRHEVPPVYLVSLVVALTMAAAGVRLVLPRGGRRKLDRQMFFLGAAFMLLETRSLVSFALLFGTTWMVNSLVFFAILASVLVAIRVAARRHHSGRSRTLAWYAALAAALAVNMVLPVRDLLDIGAPWLRYGAASLVTFLPIFVANVIFSRAFRDAEEADHAFASNLLGVMAGGTCEYLALATGYQALLYLVAALYAAALVAGRVRLRKAVAVA